MAVVVAIVQDKVGVLHIKLLGRKYWALVVYIELIVL